MNKYNKIIHSVLAVLFICNSNLYAADKCVYLFKNQNLTSTKIKSQKLSEQSTSENVQSQFEKRFKPQKMTSPMAAALFKAVEDLISDTTGKRVEQKVTAEESVVLKAIARFKAKIKSVSSIKKLSLQLIDRDKIQKGKRNVTYTEYTKPFELSIQELIKMGFAVRDDLKVNPNQMLKVKIRIRSYGTISDNLTEFKISDIEFANFTKDRAFIELKFADPSYEGAVFKPQMYFKKEYIKLLGTKEFLNRYEEIKLDTLSHLDLGKKTLNQNSVLGMLEFLKQAHLSNQSLQTVAINLYGREAKSFTLPYHSELDPGFDHKTFGDIKSVELQMTFDQLISFYVPKDEPSVSTTDSIFTNDKYYRSYTTEDIVSEFKTPTFIAHHIKRALDEAQKQGREGLSLSEEHRKLLEEILPGFAEYIEMIDEIISYRNKDKQLNRGKWGIATKGVAQSAKRNEDLPNFKASLMDTILEVIKEIGE